ncbi:hypothetical protein KAR48_14740 [bacterium]|nr:hypothetical protein [bacterium]
MSILGHRSDKLNRIGFLLGLLVAIYYTAYILNYNDIAAIMFIVFCMTYIAIVLIKKKHLLALPFVWFIYEHIAGMLRDLYQFERIISTIVLIGSIGYCVIRKKNYFKIW